MKHKFRIRLAQQDDKQKVAELFILSIANKKNLFNTSLVQSSYVNEFVNKTIDRGDMILVENHNNELELIGEIHYYNTDVNSDDRSFRELSFFSRIERKKDEFDTDLIEWLFSEIENKHKDVFSVEITAHVSCSTSMEQYLKKGISAEGNYQGRLKNQNSNYKTLIPLSWINPSFN
jgi:hypothetical protein